MTSDRDEAQFCLWLTPSNTAATKLSLLIACLASKYNTPRFDPHVTLAIAAGDQNNETREQALEWMRDVAIKEERGTIHVALDEPATGETRHQCVLSPVTPHGVGYARLQALNSKALELVAAHGMLKRAPAPNKTYFPHVSLMYADMEAAERIKISTSIKGFAEDNKDVELAYIELWEIATGVAENEWKRLGRCHIGGEEVECSSAGESDDGSDDWEASVEGFQAKSVDGGNKEEDWEARESAGDAPSLPSRRTGAALDDYCEITTANILEAFDFAGYIDNWQRDKLLAPLRNSGAVTQGIDGSHWLVIFRSAEKARSALRDHNRSVGFALRKYDDASHAAKAISMGDIRRPTRPPTSSKVASRLIFGALGGARKVRKDSGVKTRARHVQRGNAENREDDDEPAETEDGEQERSTLNEADGDVKSTVDKAHTTRNISIGSTEQEGEVSKKDDVDKSDGTSTLPDRTEQEIVQARQEAADDDGYGVRQGQQGQAHAVPQASGQDANAQNAPSARHVDAPSKDAEMSSALRGTAQDARAGQGIADADTSTEASGFEDTGAAVGRSRETQGNQEQRAERASVMEGLDAGQQPTKAVNARPARGGGVYVPPGRRK